MSRYKKSLSAEKILYVHCFVTSEVKQKCVHQRYLEESFTVQAPNRLTVSFQHYSASTEGKLDYFKLQIIWNRHISIENDY